MVGSGESYYGGGTREDLGYINDALSMGRIEICYQGAWRALCGGNWTRGDASVTCQQLGFAAAGPILFHTLCVYVANGLHSSQVYILHRLYFIGVLIRCYQWRKSLSGQYRELAYKYSTGVHWNGIRFGSMSWCKFC